MKKIVILLFRDKKACEYVMDRMAEVVRNRDGEVLYSCDCKEGKKNEE